MRWTSFYEGLYRRVYIPILNKNTLKIELKRYDKKTNFDIILGYKCVDFEPYPYLIGKREDQGWLFDIILGYKCVDFEPYPYLIGNGEDQGWFAMTLLSLNNNNH